MTGATCVYGDGKTAVIGVYCQQHFEVFGRPILAKLEMRVRPKGSRQAIIDLIPSILKAIEEKKRYLRDTLPGNTPEERIDKDARAKVSAEVLRGLLASKGLSLVPRTRGSVPSIRSAPELKLPKGMDEAWIAPTAKDQVPSPSATPPSSGAVASSPAKRKTHHKTRVPTSTFSQEFVSRVSTQPLPRPVATLTIQEKVWLYWLRHRNKKPYTFRDPIVECSIIIAFRRQFIVEAMRQGGFYKERGASLSFTKKLVAPLLALIRSRPILPAKNPTERVSRPPVSPIEITIRSGVTYRRDNHGFWYDSDENIVSNELANKLEARWNARKRG